MAFFVDTTDLSLYANSLHDNNMLGTMLAHLLDVSGGHPHSGRPNVVAGWTDHTGTTARPLLVAMLGDAIYETPRPTVSHIRHDLTELDVLWYVDGDLKLMFHLPDAFTITNSHNGYGDYWLCNNLVDPRNDPAYTPSFSLPSA